jgi:hypothetical protein
MVRIIFSGLASPPCLYLLRAERLVQFPYHRFFLLRPLSFLDVWSQVILVAIPALLSVSAALQLTCDNPPMILRIRVVEIMALDQTLKGRVLLEQ